ncbi:pseudoazurin [Methylophaga sp. 41_12_T18]|nr:pseudoazurin [Methylophaga sp. 41_12_T18]
MIKHKQALAVMLLLSSALVSAEEHTVNLVTSGSDGQLMVMEPGYLNIAVGDTVNFIPADATHNAQSVSVPDGAEEFLTPMGKDAKVTFSEQGVYIYKCVPHLAMGMIGVIQVGNAVNIDGAKKSAKKLKRNIAMNKDRLPAYMKQVN